MRLERDVPLAPLTTLGIGGPAKYLARCASTDDIREVVEWAAANREPLLVLAGGSNVVIADEGFDGAVLHIDLRGINVEAEAHEAVMVNVAAGEPWDDFVAMAAAKRWAGIECLSGIPGSTGATPIQNVGAYGQEVSETITSVEAFDRSTGRVTWLTSNECRFGYRSSLFKAVERERYIVLSITFRLRPDGLAAVRYQELQHALDSRGAGRDPRQVRDAVIEIRRRKGMVIDPADPDTRSDGSFFMNPILSPADFARFAANTEGAPHFPSGDGVKVPAAWLIEHAGFQKGFVHGRAGISTKHTLAIINRGGATAREVLDLARMIQDRVRERFGIELRPEPEVISADARADRRFA